MIRNFMREIAKARKEEDYLRAGDLYVLQGDEQEAVEMYIKGKHYEEAAKLLDKLDNYALAAKYYSMSGNLDRAAKMMARQGDHTRAASLFERSGDPSRASEMYFRSGNFQKAAELAEEAGFLARAAVLFEKAGDLAKAASLQSSLMERAEKRHAESPYEGHFNSVQRHGNAAGRLYSKIGEFETAARHFERAENRGAAAGAYSSAGRYDKAASAYIAIEDFHKAAEMLERAGKFSQASDMAEKCEKFEYAADLAVEAHHLPRAARLYSIADKPTKASELYFQLLIEAIDESAAAGAQGLARRKVQEYGAECGALMLRLRNYLKAGWCFEQANHPRKAAECYAAGKLSEKAAEMHYKLQEYEKAYQFLKTLDDVQNKELLAEVCFHTARYEEAGAWFTSINQPARAADAYEKGRQRYKAALLFEDLGEHVRAAELYEALEEKQKAAELFLKASEFSRASALFEELGMIDQAVECSLKTSDSLRTAKLLIRRGDQKEAILLLQKIERESPDYSRACLHLGQLFAELGIYQLALQKLQEGIGSEPVNRENMDAYYSMADALENSGEQEKAHRIYQEILALQFDYKDVLQRVKKGALPPPSPAPPSPPVGSTPAPSSPSLPEWEGTQIMSLRMPLPAERKIREYELLDVLGKGGMATVYRARHAYLKTERAIKVIQGKGAGDEFADRFIREAQILSELHHPNLVRMFEFGSLDDGVYFLVLELIQGESARQRVQRLGRLPVPEALRIGREAALGLQVAHEKGIIHRDISPDNLMLVRDSSGHEVTKIIDFGVAKIILSETWDYTSTGTFMGKPEYASPEQCGFLKEGEMIDPRSDIYSLAVTLQFMLTGQIPFNPTSPQGYLIKHITQQPKSLREYGGFPEELDEVILKALSPRRDKRHSSMDEFARELKAVERIL